MQKTMGRVGRLYSHRKGAALFSLVDVTLKRARISRAMVSGKLVSFLETNRVTCSRLRASVGAQSPRFPVQVTYQKALILVFRKPSFFCSLAFLQLETLLILYIVVGV